MKGFQNLLPGEGRGAAIQRARSFKAIRRVLRATVPFVASAAANPRFRIAGWRGMCFRFRHVGRYPQIDLRSECVSQNSIVTDLKCSRNHCRRPLACENWIKLAFADYFATAMGTGVNLPAGSTAYRKSLARGSTTSSVSPCQANPTGLERGSPEANLTGFLSAPTFQIALA